MRPAMIVLIALCAAAASAFLLGCVCCILSWRKAAGGGKPADQGANANRVKGSRNSNYNNNWNNNRNNNNLDTDYDDDVIYSSEKHRASDEIYGSSKVKEDSHRISMESGEDDDEEEENSSVCSSHRSTPRRPLQ